MLPLCARNSNITTILSEISKSTYLSLRFLDRETDRDRERDFEKDRERDRDPDLDREERDPDFDLFVFDIFDNSSLKPIKTKMMTKPAESLLLLSTAVLRVSRTQ